MALFRVDSVDADGVGAQLGQVGNVSSACRSVGERVFVVGAASTARGVCPIGRVFLCKVSEMEDRDLSQDIRW